jgi:hypothetical protein
MDRRAVFILNCSKRPRAIVAAAFPSAPRPTETAIEPTPFLQRLTNRWGCDFSRLASPARTGACAMRKALQERAMRLLSNFLGTTSLVLLTAFAAAPLSAADLDTTSAIDAVTVYPDGASVTRVITLDLPSGDNTLVAKDFPLTLDPSSLRVEAHDRRDRRAAAAACAARQPVRDRQAHRGVEGPARRSRRRDFRG